MTPIQKTLFLPDGSALGTPRTANPTLTIVAGALLQAEHISQRMPTLNN